MSLPHATQAQIDAMNRAAAEKMEQNGIRQSQEEAPIVPGQMSLVEEIFPEQQEEQEYEEEPVIQETKKEFNIRALREAKERAEWERDEFRRMYEQKDKPVAQQQQQEDDDDFDLQDEDFAEGKHLKKVLHEVKTLKKQLKGYEQEASRVSQNSIDVRLRSEMPDLDQVITSENLAMFRDMEPDLAESIGNQPDMYKKAKLAYKMIKQYGIYKENTYSQDKEMAKKNSLKPKPLASVSPQQGDTPMSKANAFANGLTPALKEQLLKEMRDAMKGR